MARQAFQVWFKNKRGYVVVARTPNGAKRVAEKRFNREGKAVKVEAVGE